MQARKQVAASSTDPDRPPALTPPGRPPKDLPTSVTIDNRKVRHTVRQTVRPTDRSSDRPTVELSDGQSDGQSERQSDGPCSRQPDRPLAPTGRLADNGLARLPQRRRRLDAPCGEARPPRGCPSGARAAMGPLGARVRAEDCWRDAGDAERPTDVEVPRAGRRRRRPRPCAVVRLLAPQAAARCCGDSSAALAFVAALPLSRSWTRRPCLATRPCASSSVAAETEERPPWCVRLCWRHRALRRLRVVRRSFGLRRFLLRRSHWLRGPPMGCGGSIGGGGSTGGGDDDPMGGCQVNMWSAWMVARFVCSPLPASGGVLRAIGGRGCALRHVLWRSIGTDLVPGQMSDRPSGQPCPAASAAWCTRRGRSRRAGPPGVPQGSG